MRKLVGFVFSAILVFSFFAEHASADSSRIAGGHRYETAVNISKSGWSTANTVVIAIGDNFPDALAGGPLAKKLNAPILLTQKDKLGSTTKKEIKSLGAKNAVILGSTSVITKKVDSELENMGVKVKRIGGKDRYQTAALIAKELGNANKAIVAYGKNFPDALAIAPYAAQKGYPILLSDTNKISNDTLNALKGKKETIFVGGTAILSNSLYSKVPNPTRVAGAGRYKTAVAIIEKYQMDAKNAYVATGLNFADALTGSVLAAKNNGAILLVEPSELPSAVSGLLKSKKFAMTTALGGTSAVKDSVLDSIDSLLKNNTQQSATPINVNQSYTAKLKDYSDQDYYKISLSKPGNITIQMKQMPGYSWDGYILDKDGNTLQTVDTESGSYASGTTDETVGLPAGDYFFKVDNGSYGYNTPYIFTLKYEESNSFEKESNDTLTKSSSINLNSNYKGAIQDYSDKDYYKFSLNKPGEVRIKLDQIPKKSWDVTLMDAKGNTYTDFYSPYGDYVNGTTDVEVGLPKGTYYLLIERNTSNSVDEEYKFKVSYTASNYFEKEFNNTLETANTVELNKNYKGALSRSSDKDFYKFTVSQNGQANIQFSNVPDVRWEITVKDKEGNNYASFYTDSSDYATGKTNIPIGLPAGEYYVIVEYGSKTTQETYELMVAFTQGNNFEKEVNDTALNANKINFNEKYYGSMQGSSDDDFYYFELDKKTQVNLKVKNKADVGWRAYLKKSDGSTIDYLYTDYSDYATGDKTLTATLSPGKYYILMDHSRNSAFETYTFSLTK
jgi:putative cell wall-binding protein